MQIIDNLLAIHNIDDQITSIYDIKLPDFNQPLTNEGCAIDHSTF